MNPVVQLVPNFSEGKDTNIIEELVSVAQGTPGASLIDYSSDVDHNRSVFTLIGNPQSIVDVAFKLIERASQLINMETHQGGHPRMGATDVCPIIPVKDITVDECIVLANSLAQRVGEELEIPVFLYEDAATDPSRKNLAKVRRGEYEGMGEKLREPEWQPDYGPAQLNSSAGVTAIGVRKPLVAYNIYLDTADVEIANKIAKSVRGSSGGYKYCKAIGLDIEGSPYTQVSMNITDFEKMPLYRILETVRFEAQRYGVPIVKSEIIGLTPLQALVDSAQYYLQLNEFNSQQQILENYLFEK